jgi:RHS repeat-associated protein
LDPRHLLALLLLAFVALATRVLAMRPRRLLAAAAALTLASTAATLSCHSNPDHTLTPDEHTRFHVADRLGSASLVLDHRGRVLTRDAADPYGASRLAWRADDDTAAPTYRFTGKEDDPLSGAIAIGARHYLPELGRWASPDPHFLIENPDAALATPGEANPYSYVGGNPVSFTDPTGRKGLAHGSENRPGVLDNYPDSPNPGFNDRMTAVARDRALAEYRGAQLASMALGVLDVALTGLDWALTASDVADFAALAAGPPGVGLKLSKQGAKLAIRQARKAVRRFADDALKVAREAGERLGRKPGAAGGERAHMRMRRTDVDELLEHNRAKNGGQVVCENCGVTTVKPQKSTKGVTPPKNEWQADHIIARDKGGDGSALNGEILCRGCNREKGTK